MANQGDEISGNSREMASVIRGIVERLMNLGTDKWRTLDNQLERLEQKQQSG